MCAACMLALDHFVKLVYVQHLSLCFVASFAVGLAGVLDLNL